MTDRLHRVMPAEVNQWHEQLAPRGPTRGEGTPLRLMRSTASPSARNGSTPKNRARLCTRRCLPHRAPAISPRAVTPVWRTRQATRTRFAWPPPAPCVPPRCDRTRRRGEAVARVRRAV